MDAVAAPEELLPGLPGALFRSPRPRPPSPRGTRSVRMTRKCARLRKEIDRAASELQTALDREKQQFGLVHEAFGRASTVADLPTRPTRPSRAWRTTSSALGRGIQGPCQHEALVGRGWPATAHRRGLGRERREARCRSCSPWSPSRTQPRPSPGPGPRSSKPSRRTRCVRMPSMGCDGGETPWPTTSIDLESAPGRSLRGPVGGELFSISRTTEGGFGQVRTGHHSLGPPGRAGGGAPSWPMTSLSA